MIFLLSDPTFAVNDESICDAEHDVGSVDCDQGLGTDRRCILVEVIIKDLDFANGSFPTIGLWTPPGASGARIEISSANGMISKSARSKPEK
jgi:hypothetical protein